MNRGGNDLPGNSQRLQGGNQGYSAVGEEANMFYTEIFTQCLFQLFMKGAAICEYLVVPDLLQVWDELFQRRQRWLGDKNIFFSIAHVNF